MVMGPESILAFKIVFKKQCAQDEWISRLNLKTWNLKPQESL